MNSKINKPTQQAQNLTDALRARGLRVRTEVWDGHKTIDIEITDAKVDIEVDGLHHLTSPDQILSDLSRGFYSGKAGFHTIHIPNEMVDKHLYAIADALADASRILTEKIKVNLYSAHL